MTRIEALREQYAAHGNRVWSWDSIPQACKHEPAVPTFWGPSGGFATAGEMDLACNTMEALGLLLRAVDAARALRKHGENRETLLALDAALTDLEEAR